jgi:FkbM family methyltransferase
MTDQSQAEETQAKKPHPLVGKTPQQAQEWFWEKLYKPGEWEPETRELLKEILYPGALFVDIGAWIGPVTMWALECGSRVVAIEPDPVALPELRRRVPASVEIWEGAVATQAGAAALTAPKFGISGSRLVSGGRIEADGEIEVRTWTLAEILAGRKPTLVKIDIEGYEIELLPTLAPYLADLGVPMQVALHGTLPNPEWFSGYREVKVPQNPHHALIARP